MIMTLAMASNDIALSLATLFFMAGGIHVAAPRALRLRYRSGHFGHNFHHVAGIAQILAGLFLAVPQTRIWGGILAAFILFVTVVWLLNRGKYGYAVPAILVMAALAPAVAVSL
jgi:hypothetical protein